MLGFPHREALCYLPDDRYMPGTSGEGMRHGMKRRWSVRKRRVGVAWRLMACLAVLALPLFRAQTVNAGIGDLTQLDYRWYQNVDAPTPTTAMSISFRGMKRR